MPDVKHTIDGRSSSSARRPARPESGRRPRWHTIGEHAVDELVAPRSRLEHHHRRAERKPVDRIGAGEHDLRADEVEQHGAFGGVATGEMPGHHRTGAGDGGRDDDPVTTRRQDRRRRRHLRPRPGPSAPARERRRGPVELGVREGAVRCHDAGRSPNRSAAPITAVPSTLIAAMVRRRIGRIAAMVRPVHGRHALRRLQANMVRMVDPGPMTVEQVPLDATDELRRRVLRPDQPPRFGVLAGFEVDGAATFAVLDPLEHPIATVTVMPEPCPWRDDEDAPWRLRGMATEAGSGARARSRRARRRRGPRRR